MSGHEREILENAVRALADAEADRLVDEARALIIAMPLVSTGARPGGYTSLRGSATLGGGGRRMQPKTGTLIILAAAFVSFLVSVVYWFGVFGDPDRALGLYVGIWVPSILALGALLSPRGGRR